MRVRLCYKVVLIVSRFHLPASLCRNDELTPFFQMILYILWFHSHWNIEIRSSSLHILGLKGVCFCFFGLLVLFPPFTLQLSALLLLIIPPFISLHFVRFPNVPKISSKNDRFTFKIMIHLLLAVFGECFFFYLKDVTVLLKQSIVLICYFSWLMFGISLSLKIIFLLSLVFKFGIQAVKKNS